MDSGVQLDNARARYRRGFFRVISQTPRLIAHPHIHDPADTTSLARMAFWDPNMHNKLGTTITEALGAFVLVWVIGKHFTWALGLLAHPTTTLTQLFPLTCDKVIDCSLHVCKYVSRSPAHSVLPGSHDISRELPVPFLTTCGRFNGTGIDCELVGALAAACGTKPAQRKSIGGDRPRTRKVVRGRAREVECGQPSGCSACARESSCKGNMGRGR